MVNFVSPGVYVLEKDLSDYTPAVNPTVVGIVGFATKGPTNKATLITSQENLVKTFGRPRDEIAGQGIEGALEILETANQTYFVRAADAGTANSASALVDIGACPAVAIAPSGYGVGNALYLRVQITDNAGNNQFVTPRTYTIPATTMIGTRAATNQVEALQSVIGGSLDADKLGVYMVSGSITNGQDASAGAYLVANFAGSGATLSVSNCADSNFNSLQGSALVPLDISGQVSSLVAAEEDNDDLEHSISGITNLTTKGWSFLNGSSTDGLGYLVESLYPGDGYNTSTLADGSIIGNSVTVTPKGFQNVTVNVNDLGVTEESFLTSLVASGAYIEEVINTGATDLKSDLIKGNLWSDNATFTDVQFPTYQTSVSAFGAGIVKGSWGGVASNEGGAGASTNVDLGPGFVKLIQGTTNLVGGTNGDGNGDTDAEAAALIGVTSPTRTGMQALNEELVPITIAIVPGITSETVQNNLITLAETTGNFIAVLGTPIGIGQPADAIDFANGQTPYRSASLNSSYAALYYPAVKVFQPFLGKDIFMDPAIFAVRQMGYTDTVADLWFAPAGFVRGRLTKPTDTEVDINQGDRDSLYSGGNIVNPIVNFPQQGITIFGQKTTQRAATALDRINVRRLMVYIKRVILQSTQRFIFEPNDKITQERIQTLLVPLFEDIKRRRGITEFKVICDETVNTPVRVDRNELWCKILIKPTKAAEVLVFELNVTSQATNISS